MTGWLVTGAARGTVTGVVTPVVAAAALAVFALYRWLDPPELPPGTITTASGPSLEGAVAGVGYLCLLTMIASSVGAVVGAAVGLVTGAFCAALDAATRWRLEPMVVALVGVAAYIVAAVAAVSTPSSDLPAALAVAVPGVIAALTLKAVPLGMRPAVRSRAMSELLLRPAEPADGERLREIERAAGERFRDVDLAAVAEDEPMSIDELTAYASAGRSWVATIGGDRSASVVGYVLVDEVDGQAHVEQISVDPVVQGSGIGRALLGRVEEYARAHGMTSLTLTTFRDVPWNAPLYAHLGFRELRSTEVGPELAARVEVEASHGLDPDQRVCMQRVL